MKKYFFLVQNDVDLHVKRFFFLSFPNLLLLFLLSLNPNLLLLIVAIAKVCILPFIPTVLSHTLIQSNVFSSLSQFPSSSPIPFPHSFSNLIIQHRRTCNTLERHTGSERPKEQPRSFLHNSKLVPLFMGLLPRPLRQPL